MELREPPRTEPTRPRDQGVRAAHFLILGLLLGLGLLLWLRTGGQTVLGDQADRKREVASKLKAAGALDEAAGLFEEYLGMSQESGETRAKIAYSLGVTYLDRGRYEEALRWFYEAETLGAGPLAQDVSEKIVHTLERLGRIHAARAELERSVRLEGPEENTTHAESDPVVAHIGEQEIYRSDVLRSLETLPPEMAAAFSDPAQREAFLRKYVADELLWRKAQKLEYDEDPVVRERLELLLKQLTVARFIEDEVVGRIDVVDTDLQNYFAANQVRYQEKETARVRILVVASRSEADSLRERIEGGESFGTLASSHSLHAPTRESGGLLGRWVARGEPFLGAGDADAVGEALFALNPGDVTAPVPVGDRFVLLELQEKRAPVKRELEEVRGLVERDYRMEKIQAAYEELVQSELSGEEVELFPEKLQEQGGPGSS